MKASHKSIKKSSNNPIDGFVKNNIDLLNLISPPTLFWSKNDSWNIIKSKIKSTDRKIVIWGMALAATVSMTIAAGIQFHLIPKAENNTAETVASLPTSHYISYDENISKEINNQQTLSSITPLVNISTSTKVISLPKVIVTQPIKHPVVPEIEYNRFPINKIISPYITLGNINNTLKPEIGIDIIIFRFNKNVKSKNFKLGFSTELVSQKTKESVKARPYHFANLAYENINTTNNKGWSIKTGILLNPDSNYYKGTTVKFVLSRKFNEWLKIGPELIFTNGMKSIYPTLSISLG